MLYIVVVGIAFSVAAAKLSLSSNDLYRIELQLLQLYLVTGFSGSKIDT